MLFEVVFLGFLNPLMEIGSTQTLSHADLGELKDDLVTKKAHDIFAVHWKEQLKLPEKDRSIWKALLQTVGYKRQLFGFFLSGIAAASAFGPPLILKALNEYFNESSDLSKTTLWILVFLLLVIPVIGSSCLANCYVIFAESAIVVRNVLTSAVYRKIMVLSPASRREFNSGQIVNLFSVDINMILMFIYQSAAEVYAPLQLGGALYLIHIEIGDAMYAGFGLVFGVLPLLLVTFMLYGKLRADKNVPMDNRIKLTNEILNGIRIIKYYGWEVPFMKQIEDLRVTELGLIFKMQMVLIAIITLITSIPFVMPIVMFYAYASKAGNQLTVGVAFTTLALLGLVTTPVMMIPGFIQRWVMSTISMNRINKFLTCSELNDYVLTDDEHKKDDAIMYMDGASFAWSSEEEVATKETTEAVEVATDSKPAETKGEYEAIDSKEIELTETGTAAEATAATSAADPMNRSVHTLMDMDFQINPGELVAVVGGVGSGKSSLLAALMGEIGITKGSVYRGSQSVAYHCQQPWILNATLQDNILFGLPYDKERFDSAIDAACLSADISILPAGLETEIGEKGINLSGGQKARVSFARTVYRNADIYLLDDPLSAVDAHVGQHLFTKGICGALKGKTVVLVTHQVHLLSACDKQIVLLDGRVRAFGSPEEVRKMGVDISKIAAAVETSDEGEMLSPGRERSNTTRSRNASTAAIERARLQSGDDDDLGRVHARSRSGERQVSGDRSRSRSGGSVDLVNGGFNPDLEADLESSKVDEGGAAEVKTTPSGTLHTTEERVVGDVSTEMYLWYWGQGGYGWVVVAMLIALGGAAAHSYASFWLADWGEDTITAIVEDGQPLSTAENLRYVDIYCILSMMGIVSVMGRTGMMVQFGVVASKKMHYGMISSVMSSPVSFFDTTPVGRIVNRFTSDTSLADEALATNMAFTVSLCATFS